MPDKITYYAIVDGRTTVDNPYGLVRRLAYSEGGYDDEALQRNLSWEFTPVIVAWKRGNFDDDLVEVSPKLAHQIIERFREKWSSSSEPPDA
jgi:hypothetical protein